MKLNQAVVKCISAATAADLELLVNDFLRAAGEATLISMHYAAADGTFTCMIVYAN